MPAPIVQQLFRYLNMMGLKAASMVIRSAINHRVVVQLKPTDYTQPCQQQMCLSSGFKPYTLNPLNPVCGLRPEPSWLMMPGSKSSRCAVTLTRVSELDTV